MSLGIGAGLDTLLPPWLRVSLPPAFSSASRNVTGDGDCCFGSCESFKVSVSWATVNPDNTLYRVDIDRELAEGGGFSSWQADAGMSGTNQFLEDTGAAGNLFGSSDPSDLWRRYRFRIIRRSDSAVIDELIRGGLIATFYSDPCT